MSEEKKKLSEEEVILELHAKITAAQENFRQFLQLIHDESDNSEQLKRIVVTTAPHALPVVKGLLAFKTNLQTSVDLISTGHFEKMKSMNQEQRSQYLTNLSELIFAGGQL